MTNKTCNLCLETKDFIFFYKKPRGDEYVTSAGYTHLCIECTKKQIKVYVKNNKGKCSAGDKDYKLRT